MVYDAERTAANAEADKTNDPGYCLQQCRIWAGIPAMYPDATTAWKNTNDRYPGNKNPPRGSAVYWTGGSHGYGHIAISLGNGKVRSTDAGGSGKVATVDLGWVQAAWGLPYAGWAWDINEVTIPHGTNSGDGGGNGGKDEDVPDLYIMKNTGSQNIPAGTWQRVSFPDDGAIPIQHGSRAGIGGHKYSMSFYGTVTPKTEKTIRTRTANVQKQKDDSWKVTNVGRQVEHPWTSGATYVQDSRSSQIGSGYQLTMEIYLEDGGTLEDARWEILQF